MLNFKAQNPAQIQNEMSYISKSEVANILQCSVSTIDRYRRLGNFPSHRQIGPRSIVWLKSEVLNWVESKKVA